MNRKMRAKKAQQKRDITIGLVGFGVGSVFATGINALLTHKKLKEFRGDIDANAEEIYRLQKNADEVSRWVVDHDSREGWDDEDDYEYDDEDEDIWVEADMNIAEIFNRKPKLKLVQNNEHSPD